MLILWTVAALCGLLCALELAPLKASNKCTVVRVRKEYRDMAPGEWSLFASALKKIEPEAARWTKMHLENVPMAHGVAPFLPWHRLLVVAWELRLRELEPNVTVPYWDWSMDWDSPLSSPIFTMLPIRPGPKGDCKYRRTEPTSHCLTRNYNASDFTTFYSRPLLQRILTSSNSYERLWKQLEPAPHGIVHAAIGGPGGDMTMMHSPNDFIFWLHHTNIDRLWAEWQDADTKRFADYSGSLSGGKQAKMSDQMAPFGVIASDALDYRKFCYQYQPYSGWSITKPKSGKGSRNMQSIDSLLPQPLPDHFLAMHGMNVTEVREQEVQLNRMMREELERERADASVDSGANTGPTNRADRPSNQDANNSSRLSRNFYFIAFWTFLVLLAHVLY